jgi:hypothetical protein
MENIYGLSILNNQSNEIVLFPGFIYDNRRICKKIYILFKLIGLIFYTSTLPNCNKSNIIIIMIVAMYLATINSACYEYEHFKRYGTIFSSINEFEEWKKKLYPKSRIIFSIIELIIKIVYFVRIFPPQCEFQNLCQIAESIFKIHIMAIFMIYIIVGVFLTCLLCSVPTIDIANSSQIISSPNLILVSNNQNEECCICMDIGGTNAWSMLQCGHKFHGECISTWLRLNQTCPICRIQIQ